MAPSSKKSLKRKSKDDLKPQKVAMKSKIRKNRNEPKTTNSTHKNAVEREIPPMQVEDEAPDFPRGGGNVLSRQEAAEARAEADQEFELEQRELKKKRRPTKSYADDDDLGSLFSGGITGKLPKLANRLTLKNVSPGMKVWGIIVEVNQKDLVISLPGGLRGFVRAEEASDIFSQNGIKDARSDLLCRVFHIGQLVSCIVLHVDDDKKDKKGSKRILLSLRLALLHKGLMLDAIQEGMVLTGYVKSIEDHGYILSFGLASFSGFLPRKSQDESGVIIQIGQLIQGLTKSIDKARGVVYLTSDPDVVSKCMIKDLKGLSIDLLVPGMMVTARVQATLENGILLSFLTYFTGTVDIFHLQSSFPTATWKDDYSQNKKVIARILFIDPSSRAVGLTMNTHLIHNKAPPSYVKPGDILDTSRVVRVDRGFGLLLEIPSATAPTPGYVGISDVADAEVRKLEKKFKAGSHVRVRVLGFKHLEGLAVGTLKASALEGSVFTHSDVKPGMRVMAKVISLDDKGALVQFPSGVKALCPVSHMSEFEYPKPSSKFKVGAQLLFRVLGCKSKRVTVTYKKTLVRSKLDIIASFADATEGFVTHGWIEKVERHGCFVRFYNGVKGFAHRTELGLDPGSEAGSTYHAGQVMKCRVISISPDSRRISLSFVTSSKRVFSDGSVPKLGSLVSGVVERLTPTAVIIHINTKGYMKGAIYNEHLSDYQGHSVLLRSLLKPGCEFDQLLVLDTEGDSLILSAKHSFINSAEQLPVEVTDIHPRSVVHGYVCNSIETGYFVRFLGRLTGFAPRNKVTDDPKVKFSEAFYIGQSVRSHIVDVNCTNGRIKLSLKQSSCFSTDASFIHGYFLSEEKIAQLQLSDSNDSDLKWVKKFKIGSLVEGEIHQTKEFGVVVSFKDHIDVFGFIPDNQLGGKKAKKNSVIQALVLDVSKADRIVDLSLKPELVSGSRVVNDTSSSKKKRRRDANANFELHQKVNAVVEIVKEKYLVLSIPEYGHAIGYASIDDYNTQKLPHKHFVNGDSVAATIEALPGPSTAGRLLLLLKSLNELSDTSSSKRAKKKSSYNVGSIVQAEITNIKPLELRVKFGIGFLGRIHITEVNEDGYFMEKPFTKFKIGQMLTARIVAKSQGMGMAKDRPQWELSVKPSVLAESKDLWNPVLANISSFSLGEIVKGYVMKLDNEWVWLTVSRYVKAQLFILDSSCEPSELQDFHKHLSLGQLVSGSIISINEEKKLLRLTSLPSVQHNTSLDNDNPKADNSESTVLNDNSTHHILQGGLLGGRISKILPGVGGLVVQIGPHLYGKVHYTELTDLWVSDPLSGFQEGQFVKCKVIEISRSFKATTHVDLSLRIALEDYRPAKSAEFSNHMDFLKNRLENIEELQPNMEVQGYVKNVTPKGCFVMLSRKIDAKILLSNLSDGYVENPEKEYPAGKLIKGKVLSVEPLSKRIELTLKTTEGSRESKLQNGDLGNLHVGDVISGTIKRVESFGLFISIDQTNMVGLCHISELSDNHIENIENKYKAGERVEAKILKVDVERHRVSLGMKSSYLEEISGGYASSDHRTNEPINGNPAANDSRLCMPLIGDLVSTRDTDVDYQVLAQVELRASVPPLEVNLEDLEGSDSENELATKYQEDASGTDVNVENRRRQKRKEKEEREMEIRAAEERLLEEDAPQTADEFEKFVRSTPNSSYAWIKYMNFMLSLADAEKARSIAERALRTINFREEAEKLNIWVAYFNLENKYGNPPEEAVMRTFQRALQYCDPKKVHFALLGIFETTEQHNLADELLEKMLKKFKKSCKVWLRRVQCLLRQGKDGIQSVVNRALLSLPHHKHIKFISRTAILEFKHGVADRGRSMFEGILREYPKRTDLWSLYLDQEIRLGDAEFIRALFERATSMSLQPKKMKSIFKKYLEYEKSCGDDERVEYVKKKAMEYVEG